MLTPINSKTRATGNDQPTESYYRRLFELERAANTELVAELVAAKLDNLRSQFGVEVKNAAIGGFQQFYDYVLEAQFDESVSPKTDGSSTLDYANCDKISFVKEGSGGAGLRASQVSSSNVRNTESALTAVVVSIDKNAQKDYIIQKLFSSRETINFESFLEHQCKILRDLRNGYIWAVNNVHISNEKSDLQPLIMLFSDQLLRQVGMKVVDATSIKLKGHIHVNDMTQANRYEDVAGQPDIAFTKIGDTGDLTDRDDDEVTRIVDHGVIGELKVSIGERNISKKRDQNLIQLELIAQERCKHNTETSYPVSQQVVKGFLSDFLRLTVAWRVQRPCRSRRSSISKPTYYVKPRVYTEEDFILDFLMVLPSPDDELIDLLEKSRLCEMERGKSVKSENSRPSMGKRKRTSHDNDSTENPPKKQASNSSKGKKASRDTSAKSKEKKHEAKEVLNLNDYDQDEEEEDLRRLKMWVALQNNTVYLSDEALEAHRCMDSRKYVFQCLGVA